MQVQEVMQKAVNVAEGFGTIQALSSVMLELAAVGAFNHTRYVAVYWTVLFY